MHRYMQRAGAAIAAAIITAGIFAGSICAQETEGAVPSGREVVTTVEEVEDEVPERNMGEEYAPGPLFNEEELADEEPGSAEDEASPSGDMSAGESSGTDEDVLEAEPAPSGFFTENGATYYYLEDGSKATGWKDIEGRRYCFSDSGVMLTGIQGLRASKQNGQRVKFYFD